jgi:ABC-type multidrug transport system ATPase subunit
MPPRIATSHLRVDVGGVPAIDGLTLASTGDHVLVLGAARALFEAAAGLRAIARGELRVEGVSAPEAIGSGLAASAPLDPPMPAAWTVLRYTTWSARLAGHDRVAAFALATDALSRMQLTSVARAKLAAAPLPVRRATVIAGALATGAETLLLEDPMLGLDEQAGQLLARAIARATVDRRTAVFAARVPLESPIALAADEAIVVDEAQVTAQGAPAEIAAAERTLALRVHGQVDAFLRGVEASGGRAEGVGEGPQPPGPPRFVRVELGPLSSRDLFRIAAESDAVVIELRPLARPFS